MSRETLIEETVKVLTDLPEKKLQIVEEFIQQISQSEVPEEVASDLSIINAKGGAFNFLNEEEELYSDDDLIEKY